MGNKLTKKLGPLPVWAWALVIVGGYLAAKYLRGHSSAQSASDANASYDNAQPVDPGSGVGAGASAGGGGGGSDTGGVAVAPSVAGGFTAGDMQAASAPYMGLLSQSIDALIGHNDPAIDALSGNLDSAIGGLVDTNATLLGYIPLPTADTAHAAHVVPASKSAVPKNDIVASRVLKNGALLTTYADGRQEEQLPGHSAYVTKAASQHPQQTSVVRPVVQTVSSGQGAKAATHSVAISPPKPAPKPAPKPVAKKKK